MHSAMQPGIIKQLHLYNDTLKLDSDLIIEDWESIFGIEKHLTETIL